MSLHQHPETLIPGCRAMPRQFYAAMTNHGGLIGWGGFTDIVTDLDGAADMLAEADKTACDALVYLVDLDAATVVDVTGECRRALNTRRMRVA